MKFRDHVPQTPGPELRACIVVPARREGDTIVGCLKALAVQEGVAAGSFEVFVVVDGGDDETEEGVEEASREHPELVVHVLPAPGRGTGPARRAGMDAACGRLLRAGRPDGLIASTDADSTVAPDWLRTQLSAVAAGAEAIGGRVELDDSELESLPGRVLRWRRARAA